MTLSITIPETPSDADREAILAPLRAFNASRAGDPGLRPVAILLTDQAGRDVGGLWGKIAYDWLFVELLAVPEEWRGGNYGKALMQEAESIARAHGCVGVWLDTFEFQARGFYEKLGFELFGELEDHPVGQRRFFLRKRLQEPAGQMLGNQG
ncbi:GNAT family N-acetyltransferase [Edaphosphingomonas haloaromaticamans]|uniref:Acetyltransferase (GNAT) family protein n=1 Tax=Edaphosphingomonas haloaromaticamans TaxID=653954 RepID=A0A1S1HJV3_9SPHN|nr:GNAT family N-acetyltransferase [Sphingomonas haloaromaticamans]OHT21503.1 Acetyltransferase (GNAT) family protein [Sphingomonas haloaromaticamans]